MFTRVWVLAFFFIFSLNSVAKTYTSSNGQKFSLKTLVDTEGVIWGFSFLAPKEILFTERGGKLKYLNLNTGKTRELDGPPRVRAAGQGGLLDILIKDIDEKTYVYLTYSEPLTQGATTSLGRGEWKDGKLQNFQRLIRTQAKGTRSIHYGSRLVFDENGYLFMSVGERGEREKAQKLDFHHGKILRLKADGSVPKGNPFLKDEDALDEIWSYGHRNPQGMDLHPKTKQVWSCEFGPKGGDEVNIIEKGKNYGWPEITYGTEYWGPEIGPTHKEGMEQPLVHWTPAISPSGMSFYTGEKLKKWKGNLFLAALGSEHLQRIELKDQKVVKQERLLEELGERIRQVRQGPQGYLYFSTDSGKIMRVVPES